MPCTARAARVCLKDKYCPSARNTSSSIWLSDQFLHDTFVRFCRGQRRYGSHIPGPLEARRRSSKRKATSLSYIPANGPPVNPAILFTPQPQTGWWSDKRQETRSVSAEVDVPLASWFAKLFGESLDPPIPPPVEPIVQDPTALELTDEALETRLTDAIRSAQSCDTLRVAIEEGEFHLSRHRGLAKVVLRRIMEGDWSDQELHNFFLEPYFNPPGTSNHLQFLRLQAGLETTQLPSVIVATFPKAVELGLVSVSDMQAIILSCPGLATQSNTGQDVKEFWLSCITAMNQSSVINVSELDTASFMKIWLSMIHGYEMDCASAQLLWQLRPYQSKADDDLFADILCKWLLTCKANHLSVLAQVSNMMDRIPSSTVLFMITERLVMDVLKDTSQTPRSDPAFRSALKAALTMQLSADAAETSDKTLPRAPLPLENWSAVLSSLENRSWLPDLLDDSSLKSQLTALQQDTQGLLVREKLVSFAWTVLCTSNSTNASLQLRFHGLPEALISHFGFSKEGTPEDALKNILSTLDTLPLPDKMGQTRMYFSLLQMHRKRMVNVSTVIEAQNVGFASLIDNKLYQASQKSYPHALTELAESVNRDMALFEKYATGQLQKTKSTMTALQRILRHNIRLHLCLSTGWDEHDKQGSPRQHGLPEARAATKSRETKDDVGGYTNSEIVDMINRLALDIAQSPLLRPYQALSRVHGYYRFLLRYGAPIRPQMVQAFWHAGIKRTRGRINVSMQEWIQDLDYSVSQQYQRAGENARAAKASTEAQSAAAEVSVKTFQAQPKLVDWRPTIRNCKVDARCMSRTIRSTPLVRKMMTAGRGTIRRICLNEQHLPWPEGWAPVRAKRVKRKVTKTVKSNAAKPVESSLTKTVKGRY